MNLYENPAYEWRGPNNSRLKMDPKPIEALELGPMWMGHQTQIVQDGDALFAVTRFPQATPESSMIRTVVCVSGEQEDVSTPYGARQATTMAAVPDVSLIYMSSINPNTPKSNQLRLVHKYLTYLEENDIAAPDILVGRGLGAHIIGNLAAIEDKRLQVETISLDGLYLNISKSLRAATALPKSRIDRRDTEIVKGGWKRSWVEKLESPDLSELDLTKLFARDSIDYGEIDSDEIDDSKIIELLNRARTQQDFAAIYYWHERTTATPRTAIKLRREMKKKFKHDTNIFVYSGDSMRTNANMRVQVAACQLARLII